MSRAFLCVSVDATADLDEHHEPRSPRSFLGVREGIARRLLPLFAEYRSRPTLLVAREVFADPLSAEILRAATARAEVGVATDEGETSDLRAVVDAFIAAFAHQPPSHRATRGARRATVRAAEDLGVTVDASVIPGAPPRAGLDLVDAPRQPYRADRDDPARPGASRVVEVPLTVGPRRRVLAPAAARDAASLVTLAEDAIADARRARPGVPVVLHATLGCTDVVGRDEPRAHGVLTRLGGLLAFARREDVAVVGLSDVPEILRL